MKKMSKKKQRQRKMPVGSDNRIPIHESGQTKESPERGYLNKLQIIMLVFMSFFVFILYSNTLNYPFHFDDEVTIVENKNLQLTEISWEQIQNIYQNFFGFRPIPLATFAFNYYFGQYDTFGYHLFNIVLHLINGILIFFFVRKTIILSGNNGITKYSDREKRTAEIFVPFFSALIWMVHPLQTNSVTYIVQRMNSMATLFFLLTLLLYAQGRMTQTKTLSESNTHYLLYILSFISLLLSFGCKETAIIFPFIVLLYELYFFQDFNPSVLKKTMIISAVLLLLLMIIIQILIGFRLIMGYFSLYYEGYPFSMPQRVLTELRVVIYYLSLLFYPHPDRLNFDHDFPLSYSLVDPYTTILSLFAVGSLISLALLIAKKEKVISFGVLWFFGNLVIESSIIPLDIIFEHRTYLPSIMVITVFTAAVWRFLKVDRFRITFLSALAILLSFWTYQRNIVWQTPISLWQDCVKKSPDKDRPHADLGRSLELAGRIDEALLEYQKTLQINPYHQFTLRNLGLLFYRKGDLDKAIFYYNKALESDSTLSEAHNDLGVALIDKKQLEEGIYHYKQALRYKPNHPEAPLNLKKAEDGLRKINSRISLLKKKIRKTKNNPDDYSDLGVLYYQKGKFSNAMDSFQKALLIEPDHLKALKGIATVNTAKNEFESAISIFKNIQKSYPDDAGIAYNIACVYSLQNNQEEAIYWLEKAIENGFNNWELMKTDRDLKNIREAETFKKLLEGR
ncbi:MAG: tetratricopeptide repeat protein [Desulfobacteraceae bacterium]|nr:MAG: tetratricopeptide repeat protein [Desulfobacteraceae bacterium]